MQTLGLIIISSLLSGLLAAEQNQLTHLISATTSFTTAATTSTTRFFSTPFFPSSTINSFYQTTFNSIILTTQFFSTSTIDSSSAIHSTGKSTTDIIYPSETTSLSKHSQQAPFQSFPTTTLSTQPQDYTLSLSIDITTTTIKSTNTLQIVISETFITQSTTMPTTAEPPTDRVSSEWITYTIITAVLVSILIVAAIITHRFYREQQHHYHHHHYLYHRKSIDHQLPKIIVLASSSGVVFNSENCITQQNLSSTNTIERSAISLHGTMVELRPIASAAGPLSNKSSGRLANHHLAVATTIEATTILSPTATVATTASVATSTTTASDSTPSPHLIRINLPAENNQPFQRRDSNESCNNIIVDCNSTLFTSNHRGLYVPGHYLLNASTAIYQPIKQIYMNRNCDVICARAMDHDLCQRCGRPSQMIAVKSIKKLNANFVESFYQEISIMYYFVGKPNIVQLVGFCNAPYQILTDYYSLGNLEQTLLHRHSSKIAFTKRICFSFCWQISGALAQMHQSGFSHSDIKALNVFVDQDIHGKLQCYLGDFGVAQILDDSHLVVKAYRVLNMKGLTVAYAAPEALLRYHAAESSVAKVVWRAADFKRADIYSLGILLFEMINRIKVWHEI